jgi:hypothetical protein
MDTYRVVDPDFACSGHLRVSDDFGVVASGTTKDFQDLVRKRLQDELIQPIPVLKTVKDWIAADFETWEKVLKQKDEESYRIIVSGDEVKNSSSKRNKKGIDSRNKVRRKKGVFVYGTLKVPSGMSAKE